MDAGREETSGPWPSAQPIPKRKYKKVCALVTENSAPFCHSTLAPVKQSTQDQSSAVFAVLSPALFNGR
jgi:hypothetical protein